MIHLRFASLTPAHDVTVGPAPWFRIAGNFIHAGPDNRTVAVLENHQWRIDDSFYTRIDCDDRVRIRFENAMGDTGPDFGPFQEVLTADGAMHTDRALFAKFIEESQLWHCLVTQNYWPTMVIEGV